jgi:hypothetical protein
VALGLQKAKRDDKKGGKGKNKEKRNVSMKCKITAKWGIMGSKQSTGRKHNRMAGEGKYHFRIEVGGKHGFCTKI